MNHPSFMIEFPKQPMGLKKQRLGHMAQEVSLRTTH